MLELKNQTHLSKAPYFSYAQYHPIQISSTTTRLFWRVCIILKVAQLGIKVQVTSM